MSALRTLQEELKELLFLKERAPERSRLWPQEIPKRLNVYRNNVHRNWTDTLDCDFPLTRAQFTPADWEALGRRYFSAHPPSHWELNTSVEPFLKFLGRQKIKAWIKELADYEWQDLKIFIDQTPVVLGSGRTNPTVVVRDYQHQIFNWVEAGAPTQKPPQQKPEVLVFYRDSHNTCHIREADPFMLLLLEHFKKSGATLKPLEPIRRRLLPQATVSLEAVYDTLHEEQLIL